MTKSFRRQIHKSNCNAFLYEERLIFTDDALPTIFAHKPKVPKTRTQSEERNRKRYRIEVGTLTNQITSGKQHTKVKKHLQIE